MDCLSVEAGHLRGDGYIDNLTIIVPVDGNNAGGAFGSRKAHWGENQTLLHGWHVGAYNVLPTNMLRLGTTYDQGYALASHEFLHTLGAPDLYRTAGEVGHRRTLVGPDGRNQLYCKLSIGVYAQ